MATLNKSTTVTINGKAYNLTATIAVGNTARLGARNRYIANNIYGISTVGNIVSPKTYPNATVTKNVSNKALASAGITLPPTVFTVTGLGYFLKGGNIIITG